jgi:GxxExxY protein
MQTNELTGTIIDVAIDIHRRLGPGLLESVYQAILMHELKKRGLRVASEVPFPISLLVRSDRIHAVDHTQ